MATDARWWGGLVEVSAVRHIKIEFGGDCYKMAVEIIRLRAVVDLPIQPLFIGAARLLVAAKEARERLRYDVVEPGPEIFGNLDDAIIAAEPSP